MPQMETFMSFVLILMGQVGSVIKFVLCRCKKVFSCRTFGLLGDSCSKASLLICGSRYCRQTASWTASGKECAGRALTKYLQTTGFYSTISGLRSKFGPSARK